VSAHESLVALARDLVEEIAAGRALELAAGQPPAPGAAPAPVPPAKTGAGAVYPQLGDSLMVQPGDTISGLAYAYLSPPQPPGQPGHVPGQGGGPPAPGAGRPVPPVPPIARQ
jgi:hypothetical protein